MICKDCSPLLELHLDNELDEQTVDLVNLHLAACASCAAAYRSLRREQELYLTYESGAEAAPEFWDEITAKIVAEKDERPLNPLQSVRRRLKSAFGVFNTPRFSPTLTAILVLAAVGLTVGLMRYTNSIPQTPDPSSISQAPVAEAPAHTPAPGATAEQPTLVEGERGGIKPTEPVRDGQRPGGNRHRLERQGKPLLASSDESGGRSMRRSPRSGEDSIDELVREAERKYMAAIALLSRDVGRSRSRLDPEQAAQFRHTLATIDRTIAGTRRALREHPGDTVAVQYMLTAYARKVEVLREMVNR